MNQTLQSMTQLATERGLAAGDIVNKNATPTAAVKQKTFHEKELDRKISDPENKHYKSTVALGKGRALAFINSATNTKDPKHAGNFKAFNSLYNLSAEACEQDFIQQACDEFNEHEPEIKDISYESRVLARYKPTGTAASAVMMKLHDNFSNDLKAKWNKSGYRGDAKFIKDYTQTYGLVSNTNFQDGFELKK